MKPCKFCGGLTHLAFGCTKRPKKPLNRAKRMRKVGKITKKLTEQRKAYFLDNPSPDGMYYCYYCLFLGVERPLTIGEVVIEHYKSRARHPELRFDRGNLVLSCEMHNKLKGSKDGDEFLEDLEQIRSS